MSVNKGEVSCSVMLTVYVDRKRAEGHAFALTSGEIRL